MFPRRYLLLRYDAVLEACCLLSDLAELPYGDMTEVSVGISFSALALKKICLFVFELLQLSAELPPPLDWRARRQPERRTAAEGQPRTRPLQRAAHTPPGRPAQRRRRFRGFPHLP